jgi:hypothetical protein
MNTALSKHNARKAVSGLSSSRIVTGACRK